MNFDIKFHLALIIRRLQFMLVLVVLGSVIGLGLALSLPAGQGLVLGMGLATLIFALLEFTNRAIRRPTDLMRSLGVQPLATIPFIEQESGKKRRRLAYMFAIAAAVIAVPLAVWALHTYYMPRDLLFEKISQSLGL